jgi:hypothetical protein
MTVAGTDGGLPFRGEFGASLDLGVLAAENAAGRGAGLLAAVRRDPHLAALDRELGFANVLRRSRRSTFDAEEFLMRGRAAIGAYCRRERRTLARVFTPNSNVALLLEQKLFSLSNLLVRVPAPPQPRPLVASTVVLDLFKRAAYVVALAPVCGARLLYSDQAPGSDSRFAWRLSTPADRPSRSFGAARAEVGRAVFVDDVDLEGIRTQVVIKGVGPTRFANNRFSRRSSGVLTLLQGERDWQHSAALTAGGIPVYRPIELTLLPYWEWHPRMGWRPMVIYARLPLENLRVSDLEVMPASGIRQAIAGARQKLAAITGLPVRGLGVSDIARLFAARVGRIAGLCEAGSRFRGQPFFHGFLHPQNFSLLGELVDLGEGRFVDGSRELAAAFARSGYVNPKRNWTSKVRHAGREAEAYLHTAQMLGALLSRWTPVASLNRRDISLLFWRSYREGLRGLAADEADELLAASASVGYSARGAA